MKCQDCNENESSVSYTQIVNNEKTELHLCKECAEKRGFPSSVEEKSPQGLSVQDFLSQIAGSKEDVDAGEEVCTGCGIIYAEFKKKGRLGCSRCYESFRINLQDILRKIHGNAEHVGKTLAGHKLTKKTQALSLDKLKLELKKAVKIEEFERAAQLRDQIKKIEIKK